MIPLFVFDRWKKKVVAEVKALPVAGDVQKSGDYEWAWKRFLETQYGEGSATTKPYQDHPYIYRCTKAIAVNIAQVPMKFWRGEQETDPPEEFSRIGNGLSLADLIEGILTYLGLEGLAYIWLDRDLGPNNVVLRLTNPDWIEPKVEGGRLVGWRLQVGAMRRSLEIDEVVPFRYFNPYDPLKGLAPYQAAKLALEQDWWAAKFNAVFFQNAAEPSGLVSIKEDIGEKDFKRFVAALRQRAEGLRNAHRLLAVQGSEVEFKKFNESHRDMQFGELRKYTREEICAAYGVPPVEAGIFEYANYANSDAQMRQFWSKTLFPNMRLIEGVFNRTLLPRLSLKAAGVEARFDRDNIPDLAWEYRQRVEAATKLISSGFAPGEVNEKLELGFQEDPRRDRPLVSSTLRPLEEAGQPAPGSPPVPKGDKAKGRGRGMTSPDEIWQSMIARAEPLEAKAAPAFKRYFYDLRKAMLKRLEQVGPQFKVGQMDWGFWDQELLERVGVLHEPMALAGAKHASAVVGVTFDLGTVRPVVAAVVADRRLKVKTINETIRNQVHEQIKELTDVATQEGWAVQKLAAEIEGSVKGLFNKAANRSTVIARTEVMSVMNQATQKTWKHLGIEKIMWITARDADVRLLHRIEGEVIEMGQTFSNGLRYPGDPAGEASNVINCRCTTRPVLE